MMLKRYSVQWRSTAEGWRYFKTLYWTRRGASKRALREALDTRTLCTYRVMKNVKGSDVEVLFIHSSAYRPFCNCDANSRPSRRGVLERPGGRRTRKHYPK